MKRVAGFTLMELLVVIGIIGTLVGGVIVVMDPIAQLGKARDAERKSDLTQIQRALEIYYDDFQQYPPTGNLSELNSSSAKYMEKVPTDPTSTKFQYRYIAVSGQQMYRLYAHLESKKDPQACDQTDPLANCLNAPTDSTKCGVSGTPANCNYGVSSPNTSP
jgi:prepilin-type N-terminal cleavage/methylation domain-containing protein